MPLTKLINLSGPSAGIGVRDRRSGRDSIRAGGLPLGDRKHGEDGARSRRRSQERCRANAVVKRVGEVTPDDLLSSDAVIIGSPVYFGNMSGEVKTFLDSWGKMGLFQDRKMRNKVGGTFATGASFSNGKELTMLTIQASMVMHQMLVTSGGGGFGASATTGPDSPGIDEKELAEANALGKRIAEVATLVKRGSGE